MHRAGAPAASVIGWLFSSSNTRDLVAERRRRRTSAGPAAGTAAASTGSSSWALATVQMRGATPTTTAVTSRAPASDHEPESGEPGHGTHSAIEATGGSPSPGQPASAASAVRPAYRTAADDRSVRAADAPTCHARPFRFGVQLAGPADADGWVEQARRIEDLGYSTVTMPDHFTDQLAPCRRCRWPPRRRPRCASGPSCSTTTTSTPLVLAKELATLDVLQRRPGRDRPRRRLDGDATTGQPGIPYDRPGVRIDRFVEALAVIKGAMADGPFSFAGEHYTITDYDGRPKPVQRPHPPILIGGGGKRVLSIAAREADIVGINGSLTAGVIGPEAIATMTAEAVVEKVADRRATPPATRLDDIELNIRAFFVSVTDDRGGRSATSPAACRRRDVDGRRRRRSR